MRTTDRSAASQFRLVRMTSEEATVELSGYFNQEIQRDLVQFLAEVERQRPIGLTLDCSHLLHVDSSILGLLVGLHNQYDSENRRLELRWVPDTVLRVLQLSRLDTLLNIETDRRDRSFVEVPILKERPILGELKRCWDLYGCGEETCVHYMEETYVCWLTPHVPCKPVISRDLYREISSCVACEVFQNNINQYGAIQEDYTKYIKEAEATYLRLVEEKNRISSRSRSLEEFAESLFNRATDAVVIFCAETGEIHSANPQAKRILKVEDFSAHGRSMFEFCPELEPKPRPWESSLLGDDSHHRRWDQTWVSSEGKEITVEVTFSPVQTPKEGSILAIAREIARSE